MSVTITGVDEVIRLMQQVDKVSQSVVTKAAKAGASIAYKQAKRDAPVDTGRLKKSIVMKAEKRRQGKKVYDIKFVGDGLVKLAKEETTTIRGRGKKKEVVTENKRSFYPVSQEYGWMTKSGKKITPKKAGYLRNAIDKNREKVKQTVLETMASELKKVK